IGALGLWPALMQTLALLAASALFIIIIGIPLGIWMARSPRLHKLLSPVLDVMQTMPSFVYLIPVLMLFGIGKVPALFATVVYAIAPLVRLTALGIR
ncbi:ABC transporter permease subunit, partial [Guyparkeria sp. 1SP6A2]|nr:ABC transporter permease subunit [Guyparkeria sp. 1SP6A2]